MFDQAIRLLVIEDNEDDAFLFLRELRLAKIDRQVVFLNDGSTALKFIHDNIATLEKTLVGIFLDLKLPGLSGLEVLRHIREIDIFNNIPIYVMTSSHSPQEAKECFELGVAKFIAKPIAAQTLSALVTHLALHEA